MLLTGDLGFKIFDEFRQRFPAQFINAGIAESNMMGVAAGLSFEGKIPFVYSIATFLTMRPFEHIRNDICFHHTNVKLIGVGGGFSYGPNGASHHALNDIALMRLLPEMTVMAPGDPMEAACAVDAAFQHRGPVYIRLGRGQDDPVHGGAIDFALGRAIVMREGKDVGIICGGLMLKTAVEAADQMQKRGVSVRLVSMPTIKPLDAAAIAATLTQCAKIFIIEEHSLIGGLGSAVLECANSLGLSGQNITRIGIPDATVHETGSQEYLRQKTGLSMDQIVQKIWTVLNKKC